MLVATGAMILSDAGRPPTDRRIRANGRTYPRASCVWRAVTTPALQITAHGPVLWFCCYRLAPNSWGAPSAFLRGPVTVVGGVDK